jgi:hypothetical protein
LLEVLIGKNINLDLFYDKNMLTKNEWCKYATINSSYICTHNCQCYFQIYVTSEKHKGFI